MIDFFNSSTTGKKTSKEHEKIEKEVSEAEETSSSHNMCYDSVSPCSAVQRNEVDAEPKAMTHSKLDTQISEKCIQRVPGQKAEIKRVLCAVCLPFPTILKRFCYRGRVLPICLPEGPEARTQMIQEHLQSEAHKECLKAKCLKKLSSVEKSQTVPLVKMLSSQRQKLANKPGSLIIHVYIDARCLTSSAFSCPSRVVAAKFAHEFDYNQPFQPYTPSDFDLQYIRPPVVQELLRTIVSSALPKFKKEIHSCIVASLRFDASMDKMQRDHQYMLLNVVDENGERDLKFIGIGHVTDPGATRHLAALKLGANDTVGFDEVMKVITHLSTDGENRNVAEHRGLWKLLDDDRRKLGGDTPLLKSVCAVHSTANACKDLCKSVSEIDHFVKKLTAISTYFHVSAKRTSEMENVAKVEGLTVRRFFKYFEVRWAEFTAALLDAILCSWQALIKFNVEQCGAEGKKFLKLLTNKGNLLLMCFAADLLFVIKVFQKKHRSDSLTIVDIEPEAEKFRERVNKLSTGSLLGGWENEFKEKYDEEANTFCEITLWEKERRRPDANLFVTDRRKFSAIRNEAVIAINTFVDKRLPVDRNASKSFTPFVKITATEDEIKEVHRSIAPDLDLANVAIQYQDLQDCAEIQKTDPFSMLQNMVQGARDEYSGVCVVLGRILACKPHSADCERIFSLYNKIKSTCRTSVKSQTVSDYLYIHMNMPQLCDFDPRLSALRLMEEKDRWVRESTKAGKQEWFSKAFSKDDKEDEEVKEIELKRKL